MAAFSTAATTPRAAYDTALSAGSRLREEVDWTGASHSARLKTNGVAKGDSPAGASEVEAGPKGAAGPLEKASDMTAGS